MREKFRSLRVLGYKSMHGTTTYFVYLLQCADNTYYCGYTTNLLKRIGSHNTSKVGAKYTRSRRPVVLKHAENFTSRGDALKREYQIKKLSHEEKAKLCTTKITKKLL